MRCIAFGARGKMTRLLLCLFCPPSEAYHEISWGRPGVARSLLVNFVWLEERAVSYRSLHNSHSFTYSLSLIVHENYLDSVLAVRLSNFATFCLSISNICSASSPG